MGLRGRSDMDRRGNEMGSGYISGSVGMCVRYSQQDNKCITWHRLSIASFVPKLTCVPCLKIRIQKACQWVKDLPW